MIPQRFRRALHGALAGCLLWAAASLAVETPAAEPSATAKSSLAGPRELPAPIEVPLAWQLSHSLCEPETAVRDPVGEAIYVSNVCGFNKDGHGFISKVSDSGELLERFWADGLDAPAGLAISGRRLWAVDVDVVRQFDLDSGEEEATLTFPVDFEVRALNDLVVAPDGTLYVSDSGRRSIYRVQQGDAQVFAQDDRLRFVNGLHLAGDLLWVGSGSGLYTLRLSNGVIGGPVGPPELSDIDGIESDGEGGLLVSIVGGLVWHLPDHGEISRLTTPGLSSTNLGYFPEIGLVVVPTGTDGTVLAFPFPPPD